MQVNRTAPGAHAFTVTVVLWYPVDTGLFVTGSFDHKVQVGCAASYFHFCKPQLLKAVPRVKRAWSAGPETVQVWDSNHVLPVASFQLDQRVYCAAMSPLAHAHALIAAGSGDPAVRFSQPNCSLPSPGTLTVMPVHAFGPGCHMLHGATASGHVQVKLCDARSGAFTHNLTGHRDAVWAAAWSPSSQWHLATGGCDGQVCMSAGQANRAVLQHIVSCKFAVVLHSSPVRHLCGTGAGADVGHPAGGLHRAAGPARQPALGCAASHADGG
jgi:DNA excision repair protein ERCC-8